ncbi:MAG: DUF1127 domain-containing protein [Alphaproteobacteria bacterium]
MAMHAMTTETRRGLEGGTSPLQGWLRARYAWFEAWLERRRQYNHTYGELSRLSDHDLADIGIARCDIPAIAAEATRPASKAR